MRIPKPVRGLLYGAISGLMFVGSFVLLARLVGLWAFGVVLLFPVFVLLAGVPVDALDEWLRRRTRDPSRLSRRLWESVRRDG